MTPLQSFKMFLRLKGYILPKAEWDWIQTFSNLYKTPTMKRALKEGFIYFEKRGQPEVVEAIDENLIEWSNFLSLQERIIGPDELRPNPWRVSGE